MTNTKYRSGEAQQGSPQESQDELLNLMTIMYIAIQETLNDPEDMSSAYQKLRMSMICSLSFLCANRHSRLEPNFGRLYDDRYYETAMG